MADPELVPDLERVRSRLRAGVRRNDVKGFLDVAFRIIQGRATGQAASIRDYDDLYKRLDRPKVAEIWERDRFFARMRVAGPNPTQITRVTDPSLLPAAFGARASSGGDSLVAAVEERRAYVADYSGLHGVPAGPGRHGRPRSVPAPRALFIVPPGKPGLSPIAIETQPGGTVVGPADGARWRFAKRLVQAADANVHEAVTHLARTHMVLQAMQLCTLRELDARHPVRVLLEPHFDETFYINELADRILLAPLGSVDQLLAPELDDTIRLAREGLDALPVWQLALPEDLARRGVQDVDALAFYPYRDHALLLWDAIASWVRAYLRRFYESDADVTQDTESRSWVRALQSPTGGALREVTPGGAVRTREALERLVTLIVFTASAQHAAVNFPQKTMMSYPPAFPLAIWDTIPEPLTEAAAAAAELRALPDLNRAHQQINVLNVLGGVRFTRLGDYAGSRLPEAMVGPELQSFRTRLAAVEATLDTLDPEGAYPYLRPSRIPRSTNI
ncbi:MAG: lipoxygenase family protein [Myxococcota bacterium]